MIVHRFNLLVIIGFAALTCACHNHSPKIVAEIWYESLPNCPCENPDKKGVKINDGWAKDKGDLFKYHRGATECFRSYPAVETAEGASGQQCCYDEKGKLITGGCGAGTPDKISTCDGEDENGVMKTRISGLLGHYNKDVKPWDKFGGIDSGWVKYNLLWKPNNGNNCIKNIINHPQK
jgi:hypothetical protein